MRHALTVKFLIMTISFILHAGGANAQWEVKKQGLVNKYNRINQTVELPREFAFPVTQLSLEKIQSVFNVIRSLDLPFEYIKGCCYERGYQMSEKIHALKINHLRVIVEGKFLPLIDNWGGTAQWFFHTAPAVVDYSGRIWIIDPALETSAVLLNDWLRKFANPVLAHTIYLTNEYLYADSEIDDQINYAGYTRPHVLQAVEGGLFGCGVLQERNNKLMESSRSTKETTLSCSSFESTLKHTQENKVSDFWAQQLMGLDLVEAYFAEMKNRGKLPPVKIHIWDSPIEFNFTSGRASHGTSVASFFINGQHASSIAGDFEMENQAPVVGSEFLQVAEAMKSQKLTQLINLSGGWRSYIDSLHEAIQIIFKKNAVIVQAAGNTPVTDSMRSDFQPDDNNFIRVGSITPEGLISKFSAIRSDFLVYAPSDEFLTARAGVNGAYSQFSHTSGAAPLVTGSLANALAVNPHLTRQQLQKLLLDTSIKMKSEATNETQYHIVNSYLLFLAAMSPEELQGQRVHVRHGLRHALSALNRVYPKCVGPQAQSVSVINETCSSVKTNFNILRQSFYLNPSVQDAAKIACIYKIDGFLRESNFFVNWIANQNGHLTEKLLRENTDRQLMLRNIGLLKNYASKELLKNFAFDNNDFDMDFYAYLMTASQHGKEIVNIFKSLSATEKERFLDRITSIGEARPYTYEIAAQDPDLNVRISALSAFYLTQDTQLKKRLLFLIDQEEERIWMILSNFLNRYEMEIRQIIASRLMDKPSESAQKNVLNNLHLMTSAGKELILRKALKSEFKDIRDRAASMKQ